MLRHYDLLGLVRPSGRSEGGYRTYSDADLQRLFQVEGLRSMGLPLKAVGRALDDPASEPASIIEELIAQTQRRLEHDREMLRRLQSIDRSGPHDWAATLQTIRLLRGLSSEYPALRQRAALSAGDERTVPTDELIDAYVGEDDPNTGGALRWAIVARADAIDSLAARLGTDDPETRRRVVIALTAISAPTVEPVLLDVLADTDADVRRHAATALGARGRAEAVPALLDLVADGHGDVDAATHLGSLARDGAVHTLILEAFRDRLDDPAGSFETRHRIVQALAELRGPDVDALLRRLAQDDSPAIAHTARALLGGRAPAQ